MKRTFLARRFGWYSSAIVNCKWSNVTAVSYVINHQGKEKLIGAEMWLNKDLNDVERFKLPSLLFIRNVNFFLFILTFLLKFIFCQFSTMRYTKAGVAFLRRFSISFVCFTIHAILSTSHGIWYVPWQHIKILKISIENIQSGRRMIFSLKVTNYDN